MEDKIYSCSLDYSFKLSNADRVIEHLFGGLYQDNSGSVITEDAIARLLNSKTKTAVKLDDCIIANYDVKNYTKSNAI